MKQITIEVPDNKYLFTIELFKNLKFVKKITTENMSKSISKRAIKVQPVSRNSKNETRNPK
jgi:hypothetical protein